MNKIIMLTILNLNPILVKIFEAVIWAILFPIYHGELIFVVIMLCK